MKKIESKIVGYKVAQQEEPKEPEVIIDGTEKIDLTQTNRNESIDLKSLQKLNLKLKRPLVCNSKTYRLKPPQTEHALYVTLSSIEQDEKQHPFEIFFNTKNPEHIEWTSALTLTISIAFRTAIETGSSLNGLISNLKETFGTSGSYLSKVPSKPKFVNGLVAEIGLVIEVFNEECLAWNCSNSTHEKPATEEEKQAVMSDNSFIKNTKLSVTDLSTIPEITSLAAKLPECKVCGEAALIRLDGCLTCTSCGDSKCG